MDNMDDTENNAKISDSAYSNSCSNSQSRRSSKSTHSGSHSSGSSGYGGKPSTSGYSNNLNQQPEKRLKDKDSKKKKQAPAEILIEAQNERDDGLAESAPIFETPKEEAGNVVALPSLPLASPDKGSESMDISTADTSSKGDVEPFDPATKSPATKTSHNTTNRPPICIPDGFCCIISMQDGVVMYTTSTLTSTLGFPKGMWVGRSFIDFVHPKDRSAFASQITNALAIPKNVNGTQSKVLGRDNLVSSMVCRIRRYRDLASGYGVKNNAVSFMPFLLKLAFKNVNNEQCNEIYLVIQASPFFSAFKIPNEIVTKPVRFIIRHAASGILEYLDPESVPYLGYLPQDITNEDVLNLYHPHDLVYLRQIYETIVKEGISPRSKPYRMRAQNGDYVRLETEWSSFINPWSKKLEFVIGKHYIVEGPLNPNVFQSPDPNKSQTFSEEDTSKAQSIRESIIQILNEVLTKPAEVVKEQLSKRCQDITKFIENLLEDQPKNDDDIRMETQDPDHSNCERDSVMLGGISPHHDYNDSKSSTETPVSYNQLNYNDNMQRYFESHPTCSYEEYNTVTGENVLALQELKMNIKERMSPSADIADFGDHEVKPTIVDGSNRNHLDYQPVRLTESVLSNYRHNAVMVKELAKTHRENRSSSKGEKEKNSNENRQKKKEHLARCNASFQPTAAGIMNSSQHQGVKRASNQIETESVPNKLQCTAPRQLHRQQPTTTASSLTVTTPATTTAAPTAWPSNTMNTFILGVGIPQQMSIVSPVAAMPGMIPMHYMQAHGPQMQTSTSTNNAVPGTSSGQQYQEPTMQCLMYGQAVYGSPIMYSPINTQVTYPVPSNFVTTQGVQYNNLNTLGLGTSNYEESTKAVHDITQPAAVPGARPGNKEETIERTDGESSYSSFYSSFFKTESGSTEGSDTKKLGKENKVSVTVLILSQALTEIHDHTITLNPARNCSGSGTAETNKGPKRKMEPPWMEQVCVTSELIYKYQIQTKSMEEVLSGDKQRLKQLEQPSMVNEQLGQLYLDLQLEGVASRLTLEEGVTSSSSSGEDMPLGVLKAPRKKREYSKLMMIYEENAPLPPPDSPSAASMS
ncbi:period circadian protein [Papilio machaon]|uniref:period circadian protein n=1 Tax=Papilio machaon TaxID=76193 RepID=UPI001E6660E6|nr:period circadian protein [Papilio machaon]